MKKVFLLLLLFCFSLTIFCQSPFDEIAPENKIAPMIGDAQIMTIPVTDSLGKKMLFTFDIETRSIALLDIHSDGKGVNFKERVLSEQESKFLSEDPLGRDFPWQSGYIFAGNNPIQFLDYDGGFKWPGDKAEQARWEAKYPYFTQYMKTGIQEITKSDRIMNALFRNSVGALTPDRVSQDLVYGSGPVIQPYNFGAMQADGHLEFNANNPELSVIQLDIKALDKFESTMKSQSSNEMAKQVGLLENVETLLHEYTHYGDALDGQSAILDINGNVVNGVGVDYYFGEGNRPLDTYEEGHNAGHEIYGNSNLTGPDAYDLIQVIMRRTKGLDNYNPTNPKDPDSKRVFPEAIDKSVLPTVPKL